MAAVMVQVAVPRSEQVIDKIVLEWFKLRTRQIFLKQMDSVIF